MVYFFVASPLKVTVPAERSYSATGPSMKALVVPNGVWVAAAADTAQKKIPKNTALPNRRWARLPAIPPL